jgi:plasmid stabilization system protein ParE
LRRRVRYDERFAKDLASCVRWLARNRSPEQLTNLRAALVAFTARIATHPLIGHEVERRGAHSYRVFPIGGHLPYLVWYMCDTDDDRAPVSLLMLMHESQDRERFSPEEFD